MGSVCTKFQVFIVIRWLRRCDTNTHTYIRVNVDLKIIIKHKSNQINRDIKSYKAGFRNRYTRVYYDSFCLKFPKRIREGLFPASEGLILFLHSVFWTSIPIFCTVSRSCIKFYSLSIWAKTKKFFLFFVKEWCEDSTD